MFGPREDTRDKMMKKYMSNPDYNFEKMNRASLACGPMVKWAIAQVNFRFQFPLRLSTCSLQ